MNTFKVEDTATTAATTSAQTAQALNYLEAMKLSTETWQRDPEDANLWHGPHGVIVNTAALEARKHYYEIITKGA